MINEEKLKEIQSGSAFVPLRLESQLDGMEVEDLLHLRGQIDARLPATRLAEMNLEEELVRQFLKVQALQASVLDNEEIPANQRAQVAGQVAATLQHLVKMQSEYHTAERLKSIEARLIRALEKVPKEHLVAFFEWYESEEMQ